MFFDKSWRGKRARNTFILFLIVVFTFGVIPFPAGAVYEVPNEFRLWVYEHVKERLGRMYGGEDKVPAIEGYVKRGLDLHKPLSGEGYVLRDSLFYFVRGIRGHNTD